MRIGPRTLGLTAGLLLVLHVLLPPSALVGQEGVESVAIVVHPETGIDGLTLSELRQIFRAERQFWPDGSRVTLLVRAPVAAERELVLQRIYQMSEEQFRQYWIAKMFRAEVAAGPKIVYSSTMARELVAAIPGGIGFLPADEVGPDLKVLRIDGRLPGDPGYLLSHQRTPDGP